MAKAKYGYGWVLKFVLAAILIGVGIYMVFADTVVYVITGIAIVIFSLFRVVPLLRSLNKEVLRTLNLIEIIFDTLIGGVLIYIGIVHANQIGNSVVISMVYRYSLAFFFYARGLIYFNSVVFFGEKTEIPKFWIHIISLSLGVLIATFPNFSEKTVGFILLLISLLGASYLGVDGFGGYQKYRVFQKELNSVKQKDKQKEAPQDKDQPIVDPLKDKEEERPYVN
jgi:hypothetical protein